MSELEVKSKLQIGIAAYYEGSVEDDNGQTVLDKILNLGLTLEEYELCKEWIYSYNDYHANDTVRYGCNCGCGGDSLNFEYEAQREDNAAKEMYRIEVLLGSPSEEYDY